jgi:hypothetical protein
LGAERERKQKDETRGGEPPRVESRPDYSQ